MLQTNPPILDKILEMNKSIETFSQRILRIKASKPSSKVNSNPYQIAETALLEKTDRELAESLEEKIEQHIETISPGQMQEVRRSLKEIMDARKNPFSEENLEPSINIAPQIATKFETASITTITDSPSTNGRNKAVESFAMSVILNEKQLAAKEMAFAGKSFCLIGAAGTGKTTAQREIAEALLLDNRLSIATYKTYDTEGARKYISSPSIAFVAYTRRAAANLQKAIFKSDTLREKLATNIMTIHSLLEYEPETYYDADEQKEKFRFAPKRTAANPLTITHLIIEESSMLGVADLWPNLYAALPLGVQIIMIGDINQLPPVFGPSILNYALVQLPIIELTEVYRNQGIVLENAHNILAGNEIVESPRYQIIRGKKPVQEGQEKMATMLGSLFEQFYTMEDAEGYKVYDPEDCIILSPFNKQALGTINMNKWIAEFAGKDRGAIVYEIIAGFSKQYLAVGDKVMFNKIDGIITSIERNPNYFGKEPLPCGNNLSRWGHYNHGDHSTHDPFEDSTLSYDNFSIDSLAEEKVERKQQASHIITITYSDGRFETISGAGDLGEAKFSLGYCLSVHKAQGSEWRKVFILFHKDHSIMLFRELFYTAATRARTDVCIIGKDVIINKAIKNQRIKGKTLKDKLEFFNSGQLDKYTDIRCVKD